MKQTVQSVDRTFAIMEALGKGAMSLAALAEAVALNKSTVHRLLQTLMANGYVQQQAETSEYSLSTKILHLGQGVIESMDIIAIAKPFLHQLSTLTGEVVHLVKLESDQGVYIDKIEAQSNIRMYSYIGKSVPLYCSAVGKAYLAFQKHGVTHGQLESVLANAEPLTIHTITAVEDMEKELSMIRNRGYAIDNEENELGVICMAGPIYNHSGNIEYAVSVSVPKFRLSEEKISQYGGFVRKMTLMISKELGYKTSES